MRLLLLLLAAICLASLASAQVVLVPTAIPPATSAAPPSIALVAHTQVPCNSGSSNSPSVDTTGATLLIMTVSFYPGGSVLPTVSDNKSNTWTALTRQTEAGNNAASQIYYVKNPTVGAGHNFAVTSTLSYNVAQAMAFSGVTTSAPFDKENGNTASGSVSSIQTGSVTPAASNSLIVAGLSAPASSATYTIDSSLTVSDSQNWTNGVCVGGAGAYFAQSSAAAINPAWSLGTSSSNGAAATVAVFK